MLEVKTDPLEASFEALEREDEDVAQLREEMAQLKARVDAQTVAAARPALSGAKAAESSAFVEKYLRKGLEAGVELKAVSGLSESAGGYAVPEEIDAQIERALTAISPIRAIASVVKVGTSGYRKLVTTGGTPSGWVAEAAGRPETDTPIFNEIAPPFGDLYANPAASQAMLDGRGLIRRFVLDARVGGWLRRRSMNGEQGAAGALVSALMTALRDVPGLSQVSDGLPLQAGDAAAVVEAGPETDWGFKDGEGAELRVAVLVTCSGETPRRVRSLAERMRAAVAMIGPDLAGWRLVGMTMLRSRVLREVGPKWTAVIEYRARMMRATAPG